MTRALRFGAVRYRAPAASSAPSVVQASSARTGAGVSTYSLTLPDPVTAGNALVWVVALDKQPGTLTMSGTGWATPVNLRSTSVSLAMSWKVAVGTETSLSGSTGGTAPPNGSQLWVCELESSASGSWSAVSGSSNSDETLTAQQSSGTSGAASFLSRAIAAFGIDSAFNQGSSFSYTNGFTQLFSPGSSTEGGEAGLWIATNSVNAGATAQSTLSRVGGSTDQMTGGILVLGKG